MKDRAYAKVNFALDVFNVRQDGYHDIKSIMVPIFFYDELEINIADEDKFICNKSYVTDNPNNSITKMINLFKEKYNINDHYEITLNKCIPTKAGLGGGTSDAGSTLRILKKLYNMDLSKQEEKELCVNVGADVLFNYYNKPAVVSGIGDIVEPFNIAKQYHVLLVKPYYGVSTKEAYEKLDCSEEITGVAECTVDVTLADGTAVTTQKLYVVKIGKSWYVDNTNIDTSALYIANTVK